MKQRDLIKKLNNAGYYFDKNGGNHDIYKNAKGHKIPVPRHREIVEMTAKIILKEAGVV